MSDVQDAFPRADLGAVPSGKTRGAGELGGASGFKVGEDESAKLGRATCIAEGRVGARSSPLMTSLCFGNARSDVRNLRGVLAGSASALGRRGLGVDEPAGVE